MKADTTKEKTISVSDKKSVFKRKYTYSQKDQQNASTNKQSTAKEKEFK